MKSLLKRRNLKFELVSLKQLFHQVIVLLRPEMLARRVTLQVECSGWPLLLLGWWIRRMSARYVAMEAAGLKRRTEERQG